MPGGPVFTCPLQTVWVRSLVRELGILHVTRCSPSPKKVKVNWNLDTTGIIRQMVERAAEMIGVETCLLHLVGNTLRMQTWASLAAGQWGSAHLGGCPRLKGPRQQ